jgi:hypothetical protein
MTGVFGYVSFNASNSGITCCGSSRARSAKSSKPIPDLTRYFVMLVRDRIKRNFVLTDTNVLTLLPGDLQSLGHAIIDVSERFFGHD